FPQPLAPEMKIFFPSRTWYHLTCRAFDVTSGVGRGLRGLAARVVCRFGWGDDADTFRASPTLYPASFKAAFISALNLPRDPTLKPLDRRYSRSVTVCHPSVVIFIIPDGRTFVTAPFKMEDDAYRYNCD